MAFLLKHSRFLLAILFALIVLFFVVRSVSSSPLDSQFMPPSRTHLLGTDQFGRDVLIRLMVGGKRTLIAAGLAVMTAVIIGTLIGGISGGVGGWVDWLLMRMVDALLAIPGILIAMAFGAAFGTGIVTASLGVGIGLSLGFSRLVRTVVNSTMSRPFIEAAKALGANPPQIVLRHLFPNVLPQALPFAGALFAWSLLSISGLEYLGLAGSPSEPSWGLMMAEGRSYLLNAPWIAFAPSAAIILTTSVVMGLSNYSDWIGKGKVSPEDGDTFP